MTQKNPKIEVDLSLVLCTYGRTNEVDNFLDSIYRQTKIPTEIIIVDQNEENILHYIIKKWSEKLFAPLFYNIVQYIFFVLIYYDNFCWDFRLSIN